MDRKSLIMSEFNTRFEDDDPVLELMYFSDKASTRRDERRKAYSNGNKYV